MNYNFELGARHLAGEKVKVAWAEFSTLKQDTFASQQNYSTAFKQPPLKLKTLTRFCPFSLSLSTIKCLKVGSNRTKHIRNLCRKTAVLSCHRCLIHTCVKKIKNNQNIYLNFNHQMWLSKSNFGYSNNCLHFSKHAVPLGGGVGWG